MEREGVRYLVSVGLGIKVEIKAEELSLRWKLELAG
jgi:hypothetical protein